MRSIIVSAVLLLTIIWENRVRCDLSSGGGDISDSIPLLASGKRQHNIMRFGKRPASGHSLIHFGKRDEPSSNKGHSFLYFGKRDEDESPIWDYFAANRDPSYKRGHAILRFGKRGPDSHNFIRFGRDGYDSEEDKRSNNKHAMMYFGKRDEIPDDYETSYEDKRAHNMIHFGKREDYDVWSPEMMEAKRQHNLLRFGKKDRKGSHALIHFGKRSTDDAVQANQSNKGMSRVKREIGHPQELALVRYEDPEEDVISSEESLKGPGMYGPEFWSPLEQQRSEEWDPTYMEYSHPDKKDGSKNVFLRFG